MSKKIKEHFSTRENNNASYCKLRSETFESKNKLLLKKNEERKTYILMA